MSHSRQTQHYSLPLYDGTDIINPLTDFNDANSAIDEALYDANNNASGAITTANAAAAEVATYDARITALEQGESGDNTKVVKTQAMIAPPFNPLKAGGYQPKEFVTYEDVLYMFTRNHSGAWDAADVETKTVYDMLIIITEG